MISFLFKAEGTFLHWMMVKSPGAIPLGVSELSLRMPDSAGGVVSSFGSGTFPEPEKEREGEHSLITQSTILSYRSGANYDLSLLWLSIFH